MKWAALIVWILTAGGGLMLLSIWLRNGGIGQARESGQRIRPPLLFSHFLLAAAGLVLWIVYLANDSDTVKWIAFVLLLAVALLGFAMLSIWMSRRRAAAARLGAADGSLPAEQRFPVPIVGLHGIAAATTLVLVFLTNIGVGES
jgi:cytochrome bd-type quinol oxidase subunit 2